MNKIKKLITEEELYQAIYKEATRNIGFMSQNEWLKFKKRFDYLWAKLNTSENKPKAK